MWDVSGVTGAAPVWLEVMDLLHRQGPSLAAAVPPGLVRGPAGSSSAMREEWFIRGTEPAGAASLRPEAATRIVYPPDGAVFAVDPTSRRRRKFCSGGRRKERAGSERPAAGAGRVVCPGSSSRENIAFRSSAPDGRTLTR
jgi:penicillin-binding protein 1C